MSEDEDLSKAVSAALAASGVQIVDDAGTIDRFERSPSGVRLIHSANGTADSVDATIAVLAVGWVAATAELNLDGAGVRLDRRGYVQVDSELRTTAPHIFAAGDVTGRALVVHEAVREGLLAGSNAVLGTRTPLPDAGEPYRELHRPRIRLGRRDRRGSPDGS